MHGEPRRSANQAAPRGPAVLVPGLELRRPIDVVHASFLSIDDRRALLAAWASDLYAVDPQPSRRRLTGTDGPVSIEEVRAALRELDHGAHF